LQDKWRVSSGWVDEEVVRGRAKTDLTCLILLTYKLEAGDFEGQLWEGEKEAVLR
jgi:hypothetical protein